METILDKTNFQDYDIGNKHDSISNIEHKLMLKINYFELKKQWHLKLGKYKTLKDKLSKYKKNNNKTK